jgi:hypothetical protein
MRKPLFVVLVLAIALLNSGHTPTNLPTCQPDPGRPGIAGAETVVRTYLNAVDRGELLTFGRRLDRSDITPVHVQYNYLISTGMMETRVYSALKTPMPVPDQPGYEVVGVCSAIDQGRIIETESHVIPK